MTIENVCVIGAGVMGTQVAQNLAQTGHRVLLLDTSQQALDRARSAIRQNVRFQSLFQKSNRRDRPESVEERIIFSRDYQLAKDVEFVVENVTENWQIKQGVYELIDSICPEHIVFAANTSAIPITRIASATKRAAMVIGVHFMNPVPLKPVVEVIRGYYTSEETVETTRKLLAQMDKQCIVVNDSPGFVSNRVLMLTINEAIYLLQEQVAGAEEVDAIFKSCFGHKMGPLETADLIGLDTILNSIEVLQDAFKDCKFRPCPLLKRMVDAGLYGIKSGQGFYRYNTGER